MTVWGVEGEAATPTWVLLKVLQTCECANTMCGECMGCIYLHTHRFTFLLRISASPSALVLHAVGAVHKGIMSQGGTILLSERRR